MPQSTPQYSLTRTVRVETTPLSSVMPPLNGLVGIGAPSGIGAVAELDIEVVGELAPSGYLIDITALDRAVRAAATERFAAAMRDESASGREADLPALVAEVARACAAALPVRVRRLSFRPCPFRSCTIESPAAASTEQPAMPTTILTETFEFAAAHRLHVAGLSDEENRRLFGKCNNPNGHGHNYRIEVAAAPGGPEARGGPDFRFTALERVVAREVMDRFDHKHLNLDCPEFRDLNPSVENIARVCHDLLVPAIAAEGGALRYVRVWETDKTSCRYPAD